MILKLKEIHQYTHQLASSDSEDEARAASHAARTKPSSAQGSGAPPGKFKEPGVPVSACPPPKHSEDQMELLSSSQGSNTSTTAASEESER